MKITFDLADDTARDSGQLPADSALRDKVIHALRGVNDPELPVNLYDLGLIYRLEITDAGDVEIDMTLTAPTCPVAGELPGEVQAAVRAVPGVTDCTVKLVWTPKWDKSRMSDAAQLELGVFF